MFDYIITHIQVCHYTYTRIKNLFDCHSSSCCPLLGSSSGSSPGLILICLAGPVLLFLLPLSSLLIFPGCSCPLGTDIPCLSISFSCLFLYGCLLMYLITVSVHSWGVFISCSFYLLLYILSYYRLLHDNVYYMTYTTYVLVYLTGYLMFTLRLLSQVILLMSIWV